MIRSATICAVRRSAGTLAILFGLVLVAGCARVRAPRSVQPAFTQQRWPSGGVTAFGVAIADYNGDGRADLAVTNVGSDHLALLLATSSGGFTLQPGPPVGEVARGILATDLNKDGQTDLVIASVQLNSAVVLLGDGRGDFVRKVQMARLAPFNVAVGDLNGDGNLDIAVANESNIRPLEGKGEVSLLFGDGRGNFAPQIILEANTHPSDVKIADLNGDGHMDIAVLNWKSRDISLFLGVGDGKFAARSDIPYGGAAAYSLAIGDVDRDGKPDMVVADLLGAVYILHNDGDGSFTVTQRLAVGAGTRSLVLTDLNKDGVLDLATANTSAGTVSVFIGQPAGAFSEPLQIPVGRRPRVVAAGDVNADGRTDLVVTIGATSEVVVLINNEG